MAYSERPKNKNVVATLQKGLTDARVFTSKMPQEVCVLLGCKTRLLCRSCRCGCLCFRFTTSAAFRLSTAFLAIASAERYLSVPERQVSITLALL